MNPVRWIAKGLRDFVMPDTSKVPEGRLKVVNATRGTVIATRLEVAASGKTRRKGLLGRDGLDTGEGLWIIPCESVHTFFMRFPIDLVYLDRENRIRKVRERVGPWRLSACLSAHSVLELPAGAIRATETQRGDTLELTPQLAHESESEKTL